MIRLMYITNDVQVARMAEEAGVDRIFVDLETLGKAERQGGMDTVQSKHTVADVERMRSAVTGAKLLVRVNPIHDGSSEEINSVIAAGADIVMLPMYKTPREAEKFISFVGGRAKTMLLLETKEADACLCETLELDGIDEMYIGLNDLHLSYGRRFMFDLLADGTVERITRRIAQRGIPYGFGGIAAIGTGTLPAERILAEHVRLGSSSVILSRSFCNYEKISDYGEIKRIFDGGVKALRDEEAALRAKDEAFFEENRRIVKSITENIAEGMAK